MPFHSLVVHVDAESRLYIPHAEMLPMEVSYDHA